MKKLRELLSNRKAVFALLLLGSIGLVAIMAVAYPRLTAGRGGGARQRLFRPEKQQCHFQQSAGGSGGGTGGGTDGEYG